MSKIDVFLHEFTKHWIKNNNFAEHWSKNTMLPKN